MYSFPQLPYHDDMSEHPEHIVESEPIDSGIEFIQEGTPSDSTALVIAKARGSLEGHALPEALSTLLPAFRSQPAWVLICQWTNQVMIALQSRAGADILIHEVRTMIMRLLQTVSITALIFLVKRLVVRKPPSLPYRLQRDEWSKIRGYRRPS